MTRVDGKAQAMFDHIQHPIPIPMENPIIHTDDHPFCDDVTCPDKDDPQLLAQVAQYIEDGLLTPDEAANYVMGKTL
jgi:hypothetical protein